MPPTTLHKLTSPTLLRHRARDAYKKSWSLSTTIIPSSSRAFTPSLNHSLPQKSSQPSQKDGSPSIPIFNIFALIREARRPYRYTVYAGLALLASVESTFWYKVIQHKYFPTSENESEEFFAEVGRRVMRYRLKWLASYYEYYQGTLWGL